ncbi:glycosyltransferase family 4 protein [Pseudomonas oryzihabitans]|nr:glycosyltransferase family 1 protein [Pseudomonas oryzihabitans]
MRKPEFCTPQLTLLFNQWVGFIVRTADGYLTISDSVGKQLRELLIDRLGVEGASKIWQKSFPLGSDMSAIPAGQRIDPDIELIFSRPESVYLSVSTIEPRKNQSYLLDAFEILWSAGFAARLCLIGKVGWLVSDLVERIRQHPELGHKLFMFNSANDASLAFAYEKSKALVFASYDEGFGLPLVEAMQRGLPVMASDIDVFREIGGNRVAYFGLNEPRNLASLVEEYENTGSFPAEKGLEGWSWVSWSDSTSMLLDGIIDCSRVDIRRE